MPKCLILLLVLSFSLEAHSQTKIDNIIHSAKVIHLPLSNNGEWLRQWEIKIDKQPKLNAIDRTRLLNALSNAKQLVINPKGGTAFGDLDCSESFDTFLDNVKEIALVGVIKLKGTKTSLIYLKAKQADNSLWYGILLACNNNGQITNWIFSDGYVNEGNPHGNISRNFVLYSSGIIKIEESAWGDNTNTYGFNSVFKVLDGKLIVKKRKFIQGRVLR